MRELKDLALLDDELLTDWLEHYVKPSAAASGPAIGVASSAIHCVAGPGRLHSGTEWSLGDAMGQGGRIVAVGLTLIVGGLAGAIIMASTQEAPAVVTQATTDSTVTVTVTVVDTVTTTVTVEPQPNDDPTGPKANGNYLVGAELAPGTWQCGKGDDMTAWFARDRAGQVTANWGAGTLAVIPADAYIADLTNCSAAWSLVG